MDIAKAKEEFANGKFRGPKHVRLLLAEVEKLQGRVAELERTLWGVTAIKRMENCPIEPLELRGVGCSGTSVLFHTWRD